MAAGEGIANYLMALLAASVAVVPAALVASVLLTIAATDKPAAKTQSPAAVTRMVPASAAAVGQVLGQRLTPSGRSPTTDRRDYLFEMQNAVEWRMVTRGPDERSQMHAMSVLLSTCEGMSDRALIDEGARWILQGERARTARPDRWCQSSLQYAGVDNLWTSEGTRETRLE